MNHTPTMGSRSDVDLIKLLSRTLVELPYETWNFGDSVAFDALLAASDHLAQERWAAFAHGWARSWATRAQPYRRSDNTAPGLALVQLATRFDDSILMEAVVGLAEYLLSRPKLHGIYETSEHAPLMQPYGPSTLSPADAALLVDPPGGAFVDCLHFDPPFFAALARATGSERYAAEAIEQALAYIALLQRGDGLFEHFVVRGREARYGPGWGRGQGWALLGMLDVLDEFDHVPAAMRHEHADGLAQIRLAVETLIAGQIGYQRADGHWFAVVDDPDSGEEYSTAGFMATGFFRALERGAVSGPDIECAAAAAAEAVRGSINANGTVAEISAAVMACTDASHYANVPRGFRVPWGQGPALLALIAAARWVGAR